MAREKVELVLSGDSRSATTAMKSGEQGQKGFETAVKKSNAALSVNEQRLRQQTAAARQSVAETQRLQSAMSGLAGQAGGLMMAHMALDRWTQAAVNHQNVTAGLRVDLDMLARATDNQVQKMDLARGAVVLQNTELELTSEQMAKLAGNIAIVADSLGEDVPNAWNQVATAVSKGNAANLKALGITTDFALEIDKLAKAQGRSAASFTNAEKQAIAWNIVNEEIARKAASTTTATAGMAHGFQRAYNRLKDLGAEAISVDQSLGRLYDRGLSVVTRGLERVGVEGERARMATHRLDQAASMAARGGIAVLTLGVSELWRALMKSEQETQGVGGWLRDVNAQIEGNRQAQKDAVQAVQDNIRANADMVRVHAANATWLRTLKAANDDYADSLKRRNTATRELTELEKLLGKGADERFSKMMERTSKEQEATRNLEEMLEAELLAERRASEARLEIRVNEARRAAQIRQAGPGDAERELIREVSAEEQKLLDARKEVLEATGKVYDQEVELLRLRRGEGSRDALLAEEELLQFRLDSTDDEIEKMHLRDELAEVSHRAKLERIQAETAAQEAQLAAERRAIQAQQEMHRARVQMLQQGAQFAAQSSLMVANSANYAARAAREAGESEAEARRKAVGEGLRAIAWQLGAMAVAEGIKGAAMLVTLNPKGALHLAAAGIYGAGAATLGGLAASMGGGSGSIPSGGGAFSGGGALGAQPGAGGATGTGTGEVAIPPSQAPGQFNPSELPNQNPAAAQQQQARNVTLNLTALGSVDREFATRIIHEVDDLVADGTLERRSA